MKRVLFNREPKEVPAYPEEVSTLTSQELSDYHAIYTAWYAYISDRLKLFRLEESKLKFELGVMLRKGLAIASGKTIKEKETKVKITDEYLELESKWFEKKQVCDQFSMELETLEKMFMSLRSEMRRREL